MVKTPRIEEVELTSEEILEEVLGSFEGDMPDPFEEVCGG